MALSAGVWHVAMATPPPPEAAPSRHHDRSVSAVWPSASGDAGERRPHSGVLCKPSSWAFPVGRSHCCPPARLTPGWSSNRCRERSARRQRPGREEGMGVALLHRWMLAKRPRCRAVPWCWVTARAELSRGTSEPGDSQAGCTGVRCQAGCCQGQSAAASLHPGMFLSLLFIKLRCKMKKKKKVATSHCSEVPQRARGKNGLPVGPCKLKLHFTRDLTKVAEQRLEEDAEVCTGLIPKRRGRDAREQQPLALGTESCSRNDSAPPASSCQPPRALVVGG